MKSEVSTTSVNEGVKKPFIWCHPDTGGIFLRTNSDTNPLDVCLYEPPSTRPAKCMWVVGSAVSALLPVERAWQHRMSKDKSLILQND